MLLASLAGAGSAASGTLSPRVLVRERPASGLTPGDAALRHRDGVAVTAAHRERAA
jgi:hypothetical protein